LPGYYQKASTTENIAHLVILKTLGEMIRLPFYEEKERLKNLWMGFYRME
jgi:hypothetical protein